MKFLSIKKTNGLFVILDHSDFILGISNAFIYIVQNVKKDCVQFCILVIAYEESSQVQRNSLSSAVILPIFLI